MLENFRANVLKSCKLTLLSLLVPYITQMDGQIVDPDPGKNYNVTVSAGDPHFKMEKRNIHRSRLNRSSVDSVDSVEL